MVGTLAAICIPAAACTAGVEYTLDKTEARLSVGETVQLTVSSSSTDEFTVTYSSANEAVATVTDAGLVTAVSEGTTTVTAEVDGTQLNCTITVDPVTYEYSLNKTSATIEEEETLQLVVTSTPVKELTVEWTTSAESVATVNQSGLVTAVAVGTAKITASVDGQKLVCDVTVEEAPVLYSYILNYNKSDLEVGKTLGLTLTCAPEREDLEVVWQSSDAEIASVSEDGLVTALKVGKVKINAVVDGGVVATCDVNSFVYEYEFEEELVLGYGDDTAVLEVGITPARPINITYEVDGDNVISIAADGKITILGLGTATVTIKDGDNVVGECVVTVNPVVTIEESVQMHVGDTHIINVTSNPANPDMQITCEIIAGDAVTLGDDGKTLTAVKNGEATVKVTAGGKEVECKVLVNAVNAESDMTVLELDRENPYDITEGAEYWEQYIHNEVNHKHYVTDDEDIISFSSTATLYYLPDYKAFLTWHGGANADNCDCGLCNKDSQNGGDGGWTDGGNKSLNINQKGGVLSLAVKAFGQSTIKVYTGGYNLLGRVVLKSADGTVIASEEFDNKGVHLSNLVTFDVDVKEAQEVTVEITFVDDYGDAGHSVLSLAAVAVTGNVYRLEKSDARVIPGGTAQIGVLKDDVATTDGVTYESENTDIATVNANGLVTGVATGETRIKVTVDGRVRYFTVKVGYEYVISKEDVKLHAGDTVKLSVTSNPAGSASAVTYTSANPEIASVAADGTVTAVANGTTVITATVDGEKLTCSVTVTDLYANSTVEQLGKDKNNPIDITDGAAYWEQYIGATEINHKHYTTAEEDVIERSCDTAGKYLEDYPAYLSWHGGANADNCDCGLCNKDSQNGGDGGWNGDKGTKAYAVNVKNSPISLAIKLYAGETTVKVYTGGYNLVGKVSLIADGEVIASNTFDNKGAHNAQCVTFVIDSLNDKDVTVQVEMIDDNNNAPHSCISLAAVSVSGSAYSLKAGSARVIRGGTAQIEIQKDGVSLTGGVTYESENEEIATVSASGLVTGVANGETRIKVTADRRVRYFTVEVGGYSYSLEKTSAIVKTGKTHQINIISNPVGADLSGAIYTSADENIATVSTSGLVTGVATGSTTITVSIEGNNLEFTVNVAGIEATVKAEDTAGTVVNLTSGDIVYWEHYLYDELNPKALGEGEKDLIEGNISGARGDDNSTVKFYFAGSSGPKENSLNDGAFHKYSWSSGYEFNITVPAGTHEIRVYTGVWQSTNKTSLLENGVEISSYEFGRTSDGINKLVAFTVTCEEEKVFTLKIEAIKGNNCRLNAIAIADTSVASSVGLDKTVNDVNGNRIDFTAANILDWATFGATDNHKEGGALVDMGSLKQGAGAGSANDYKGTINLGNDTTSTSFKFSDEYVSVNVKVTAEVKKLALYVTGWNSDYFVAVADANGKIISTEWVNRVANQSVAKELIFDINVTEETTLTLITRKMSTSNCGIAGVALFGAEA